MIHQFIFAGPKPGLSAEAFQSYWVNFHAVDYAAKIPQIRRYLVATRISAPGAREVAFFEGAAEIWLKNDEEQIASMQTPEFLQGARMDEPRWAAFWGTFVHDADTEIVKEAPFRAEGYCKLYVFLKRRADFSLADFRAHLLDAHARTVLTTPDILGYLAGFARHGAYALGEPRFDAIEVLSFASPAECLAAMAGLTALEESWKSFCQTGPIFTFAAQEHWVIPPGQRD